MLVIHSINYIAYIYSVIIIIVIIVIVIVAEGCSLDVPDPH